MTHKTLLSILLPSFLSLNAYTNWPDLVEDVVNHSSRYTLNRMPGGATNTNYKVTLDGANYFIRLAPPEAPTLYANIQVEHEVLQALSRLEISPKPHYFDPKNRILITNLICADPNPISLSTPSTRKHILELLHKIEDSTILIPRTFEPYACSMHLVNQIENSSYPPLPPQFYDTLLPLLKKIDQILTIYPRNSLCHLDLHSKNIVKEKDRFWIVDWEYAMMSHPYLSLASMASIERWDDEMMHTLLKEYRSFETEEDFQILYLYRIAIDIFWTAWNHIQAHSSQTDNPYSTWEKLFYEAALDRALSKQTQNTLYPLHQKSCTELSS